MDAGAKHRVLLVEDEVLLRMDFVDMLESLGFDDIHAVGTVDEALRFIEAQQPSFALLDYRLGSTTSQAVSDALVKRGVPFTFISGYMASNSHPDSLQGHSLLLKPFSEAALKSVISKLIAKF